MARDSRRGSAMLESALSLTLLLTMLFGIIEFGRATWMYSLTSYLANEGARYAMVRGGASASPADAAAVSAYVRGLAVGVDPAALTVDTTWSPDNAPGSMVTVKVACPVPLSSSTTVLVATVTAKGLGMACSRKR